MLVVDCGLGGSVDAECDRRNPVTGHESFCTDRLDPLKAALEGHLGHIESLA